MDDITTPQRYIRPLQANICRQIERWCDRGRQYSGQHQYAAALRCFYRAWVRLPKPQTDFEAAGSILKNIGDTYFKMKKHPQAVEALRSSLHCPIIGKDNAPVHMRLGQCLLEIGQTDRARRYLLKAYRVAGDPLFSGENPKYRSAIDDLVE